MTTNFKGILKKQEPLAGYTAWHIGGPAEIYYKPVDAADLSAFLKSGPTHRSAPTSDSLIFLGLGSNVLIADEGLKGIVIHWFDTAAAINPYPPAFALIRPPSRSALRRALSPTWEKASLETMEVQSLSAQTVQVDTRVPCAKLAKFCAKHGLKGAEFFAGIPGTVGGALAMNAGAWGRETWSCVERVMVINCQGDLIAREKSEYRVAYRSVALAMTENPLEWFVGAELCFETGGDPEVMNQNIKALLKQRQQSQPIGVFSCGSVFKNPPHDYAGRLIESCGLKGYAIGGARISEKHANFIINTGAAQAQEVRALIAHIQEVVLAMHQVRLETEVRFLGF